MIKKILVAAGPTREKIDPVRFISNYSTGTFGYAIAREAKRRGLDVTLVSGPTALKAPDGVRFVPVESSLDMRKAVLERFKKADCVIMSAAVADWRPVYSAKKKIKKTQKKTIELVENPDILAQLGARKNGRVAVGFALETENLEKNALKKLKDKNLDLIVANRLGKDSDLFGDKKIDVVTGPG
jgi:phosphopantothenoylcysteine decarboxylase/phosphopantothenate--cysteine ligase